MPKDACRTSAGTPTLSCNRRRTFSKRCRQQRSVVACVNQVATAFVEALSSPEPNSRPLMFMLSSYIAGEQKRMICFIAAVPVQIHWSQHVWWSCVVFLISVVPCAIPEIGATITIPSRVSRYSMLPRYRKCALRSAISMSFRIYQSQRRLSVVVLADCSSH